MRKALLVGGGGDISKAEELAEYTSSSVPFGFRPFMCLCSQ
jgi:hypothetical protein